MREILFRGKRVHANEWVYGDLLHRRIWGNDVFIIRVEDNGFDSYIEYEVLPETVGQDTGITDKNGTKIFEGDIVKWFGRKYTVTYKEGRFIGEKEHFIGVDEYEFINLYGSLEVIGNIHDNKELLKGEKSNET